ncbi:response regulator transcription factor [Natranaerofaba carboxydovora]|uniref:response regulator transcription factor n=1 Tax=Natranaerofaba carboxydovora TaxID=2742683 RepID=UPI001F144840|nr:response regulator transcription factor [Natranaerofaba carboxydovora]UMZ74201.1 Transcriptional regulatory protein SrrA [Natranaerofaba carboxydovora]
MEHQLLIIEDDTELCNMLKISLEHKGFNVELAYNGDEGIEKIKSNKYSLIILDVMLPKKDGWEVCQKIRSSEHNSKTPILMLTAKVEEDDKILGLKLGADDYVTKPFSPRELTARVEALIRRANDFEEKDNAYQYRDLTIDPNTYKVIVNDSELQLTHKEFELLLTLCKDYGVVFSRDKLLEKIWGFSFIGGTRTVDEHIKRLRKKIESKSDYTFIQTVWGVGYKFEVKENANN